MANTIKDDTPRSKQVLSTMASNDTIAKAAAELPRSKLAAIWANHEAQMARIEEFEKRVDEAVMRKRRRIANLIEELPAHRRSHLRVFLTHQWDQQDNCKLFIEGRLLIGHLDHESAKNMDEIYPAMVEVDPNDRSQYRGGMSEREGEVPVEPIHFTHYFDKVSIQFQTIQTTATPPAVPRSPPPTISKKGRKGKRKADDLEVSPSRVTDTGPLIPAQVPPTEIHWSCERNPLAPQIATSDDAHAFVAHYRPTLAPSNGMEVHSVVATVFMWPKRPLQENEMVYKPSSSLAAVLFPQHTNERVSNLRASDKKSSSTGASVAKKAKTSEEQPSPRDGAASQPQIPVDMQRFVPTTLTMGEIVMAFFLYAQEKSLLDGQALVCDKTLGSLLEVERLNFCDLEHLLQNKNLVIPVTTKTDPVELTYVLRKDTATPSRQDIAAAADQQSLSTTINSLEHPALLQFDMDIHVPSLFPYRAREIMRRVKQREFGYTSSRTRARNWLVAARASEDLARQRIDETVVGKGFSKDHTEVWLALARAAPDDSEARTSAQIDARICHLLDKIHEHTQAAQAAWELADAATAGIARQGA
jgi:hypothetical protein